MDTEVYSQCSGLNTNHGSPRRIRTTSSSSVVERKTAKILLGQTLFRGYPTATKRCSWGKYCPYTNRQVSHQNSMAVSLSSGIN